MRKAFPCALALSAFGLISPAFAGTVYVPIQNPEGSDGSTHATEVWVSNSGTDNRSVASTFIAAGANGAQRAGNPAQTVQVVAGRTLLLQGLGAAGKSGLLEIDTSAKMMVEARLKSTALDGAVTMTPVPVISSGNAIQPNQPAHLLGLRRDAARGERTDLVLVNLAKEGTALCNVGFYRSNGTQVASNATLSVPALSSLYFTDAFGLLSEPNVSDARAQVSCNRQFFAYTPVFYPASSQYVFVTPSASGASTLGGSSGSGGTPTTPGAVVFERSGLIHVATTSSPKGVLDIPLPRPLSLRRMVTDVDFIPGPWNLIKDPGNHAIVWIHRSRGTQQFRSNNVVNVNAFGPSKYSVKMNQNVDLLPPAQSVGEQKIQLQQGQLYHLRHVYDAENGMVTATVSQNGVPVANLQMVATAHNRRLEVNPAQGLTAEFGHYDFQHGPELASYGWQYLNLKVEMIPYN